MNIPAKTRGLRLAVPAIAVLLACGSITAVGATTTATPATTPTTATTGMDQGMMSYLVMTNPDDYASVSAAVTANGGVVHAEYERIGVIVVRSSAADFAERMRATEGVAQVGATRTKGLAGARNRMLEEPEAVYGPDSLPRGLAAEVPEWDMKAIGADKAWDINPGRPDVITGVIDTGVDDTHPDLAPNFDAARSASCVGGRVDNSPGSWRPDEAGAGSYHGTHVAGTIAAARNGTGVTGVAPGTKIAGIKVSEGANSWFYAENVVCAFMWAAEQGMSVTNNSYYVDPWQFNCPDHPDQAAIAEGVRRAMLYSEANGVLHVSAAGNASVDLAAQNRTDSSSPNDGTPVVRRLTKACVKVPAELPGSFNVSATTNTSRLASFSNFGLGTINVAAPGQGINSTMPGGKYGVLSGTSMAAPHVAGVAALIASTHPGARPGQVRALLHQQADDWSCRDHGNDRRCTGPASKNSFFGEGLVNALKAVSPR